MKNNLFAITFSFLFTTNILAISQLTESKLPSTVLDAEMSAASDSGNVCLSLGGKTPQIYSIEKNQFYDLPSMYSKYKLGVIDIAFAKDHATNYTIDDYLLVLINYKVGSDSEGKNLCDFRVLNLSTKVWSSLSNNTLNGKFYFSNPGSKHVRGKLYLSSVDLLNAQTLPQKNTPESGINLVIIDYRDLLLALAPKI